MQLLSISPELQVDGDAPRSADEFNALVTAMCGRYGVLRQVFEELADDQLRELRHMVKTRRT